MRQPDSTCSNCGHDFTDPVDASTHREPCPDCGSTARTLIIRGTGNLVAPRPHLESAVGAVTWTGTAAGHAPADTNHTSVGGAIAVYEVRMSDLDETTYIEVVKEGEVLASGVATDLSDALLDLIRFMLPKGHAEHPDNDY